MRRDDAHRELEGYEDSIGVDRVVVASVREWWW